MRHSWQSFCQFLGLFPVLPETYSDSPANAYILRCLPCLHLAILACQVLNVGFGSILSWILCRMRHIGLVSLFCRLTSSFANIIFFVSWPQMCRLISWSSILLVFMSVWGQYNGILSLWLCSIIWAQELWYFVICTSWKCYDFSFLGLCRRSLEFWWRFLCVCRLSFMMSLFSQY